MNNNGKVHIKFKINGEMIEKNVEKTTTLVDFIREDLGLTGTKKGCEEGECGACTVLLDGKTVNSCMIYAPKIDGSELLTIEGLGNREKLHPLQKTFIEEGAVQCGYCTPGMLLSAKFLLDNNPSPSEDEVREAISGNLCRCTGYSKIVKAIMKAAKLLNEGGGTSE